MTDYHNSIGFFFVREKNIRFYEERGLECPSNSFRHELLIASPLSFRFSIEGEKTMARNPEGIFQDRLHEELYDRFHGCKIYKMDQHQGIPDLLILWRDQWAMLECKAWCSARKRPNQDYWVDFYNNMSFCRFINPENMKEVLDELQKAWGA